MFTPAHRAKLISLWCIHRPLNNSIHMRKYTSVTFLTSTTGVQNNLVFTVPLGSNIDPTGSQGIRPVRGPGFNDGFQRGQQPQAPRPPGRLPAPSPAQQPRPTVPSVGSSNSNNVNNNNSNNPAVATTTRQPKGPLFQFLPQLPDFSQIFGL